MPDSIKNGKILLSFNILKKSPFPPLFVKGKNIKLFRLFPTLEKGS
jgi:hypothetical protein